MIITLIIASVFIASILGIIFINSNRYEGLWFWALGGAVISGIVAVILTACIINEHTMIDRKIEALQAKREAIAYQMDRGLYLGDALGEFNSEIISGRYYHDNPWTSWLSGDYYYKVDPIDLDHK